MSRTLIRKSQPTAGDVHINRPLTNISVAYMQSGTGFVSDKVFPSVPVAHKSDSYYVFDRDAWLRDEARLRAPGSESAGGGFTVTQDNYNAKVHAWHVDIADQVRANADTQIQLDKAASELVTQKLLIKRERIWAASFFTQGVWGTDSTPTTLWSAATGSDPQKDVEVGRMALKAYAGKIPGLKMVGVFGVEVMSALKTNATIREHYRYTSNQSITEDMIARYLGLEDWYVMEAIYATNTEGQSLTTDWIGGKHLLLAMVPSSPGLMTPAAGYTFAWTGFTGSVNGFRTKRFRMEPIESDRIEGEMAFDMKVVAPGLGYLLDDVIA